VSNRADEALRISQEAARAVTREELSANSRTLYLAEVERAVSRLDLEPGLAVLRVKPVKGGVFVITCLRDPAARDPETILSGEGGLPPSRYRLALKPYVSADPGMVLLRAESLLRPPPGVRAAFGAGDGVLSLSGEAPLGWIQGALARAPFVPGVRGVSSEGLRDPREPAAAVLLEALDGLAVPFAPGADSPLPEGAASLAEAAGRLAALELLALDMEVPVDVCVHGGAGTAGRDGTPGAAAEGGPGTGPPPAAGAEGGDRPGLALARARAVSAALAPPGSGVRARYCGAAPGPRPKPDAKPMPPNHNLAIVRVRLGDGSGLRAPGPG
jgi:hypothetical protein